MGNMGLVIGVWCVAMATGIIVEKALDWKKTVEMNISMIWDKLEEKTNE